MKLKSILTRTLLAGAIVTFTATAAQAALISWGAAQNITGDSDVDTTGTLVGAANVIGGATVNGVTFANIGAFNATAGPFTINAPGSFFGFTFAAGLSPAYQTLLNTGALVGANDPVELTISGLTVGTSYSFQWWSNGSGGGSPGVLTSAGGAALSPNVSGTAGGAGQFQIGTFMADNATQQIQFSAAGGSFGNSGSFGGRVNAFQLREAAATLPVTAVPEPTTALFGLALAGFATTVRRRRAQAQA